MKSSAPWPREKNTSRPNSKPKSSSAKSANRSSPAKVEILRHIVRGQANKEIASSLNLHVSKILEKIGAPDRTRAATLAIERGIVRLQE